MVVSIIIIKLIIKLITWYYYWYCYLMWYHYQLMTVFQDRKFRRAVW